MKTTREKILCMVAVLPVFLLIIGAIVSYLFENEQLGGDLIVISFCILPIISAVLVHKNKHLWALASLILPYITPLYLAITMEKRSVDQRTKQKEKQEKLDVLRKDYYKLDKNVREKLRKYHSLWEDSTIYGKFIGGEILKELTDNSKFWKSLIKLTTDPNEKIRYSAVHILGSIAESDRDPNEKKIKRDTLVELFIQALNDHDNEVREEAKDILNKISSQSAERNIQQKIQLALNFTPPTE